MKSNQPDQRVLIGYLTYVNEKNYERRYENFSKSLDSLSRLDRDNCFLVNFDNNSLESVKTKLRNFNFDAYCHFSENYYDLSVLYGSYYLAKKMNMKYFVYAYDDIALIKGDFLEDSIAFMEENDKLDCIRLCNYKLNDEFYHAMKTNKKMNPDAVHHNCAYKNNLPLRWSKMGPFFVGDNVFHINDWHYTSRSCLMRVDSFEDIVENKKTLPVLNFFEGYTYRKHFDDYFTTNTSKEYLTGVLEGGAFRTLAAHTKLNSERLNLGNDFLKKINIDVKDIEKEIDKIMEG